MWDKLKVWAKQFKKQIYVLYFAYKDPRTPWYAKVFSAIVVAYAFSPIDLIPDFIPILGYLDDLILVPLGVMFALKMLPDSVIRDSSVRAEQILNTRKPKNWIAGSLILFIWIFAIIYLFQITYSVLLKW